MAPAAYAAKRTALMRRNRLITYLVNDYRPWFLATPGKAFVKNPDLDFFTSAGEGCGPPPRTSSRGSSQRQPAPGSCTLGDGRGEPGLPATPDLDFFNGIAADHRLGQREARGRDLRADVHDHAPELRRDQGRLPRPDPHSDGLGAAPPGRPAADRHGRAPLRDPAAAEGHRTRPPRRDGPEPAGF